MRQFLCFVIVASMAIGTIKSDEMDDFLDRLFHAGIPTKAPDAPTTPLTNAIDDTPVHNNNDQYADIDREIFMPYRNSRHDEFDWSLTKNVLSNRTENTILSPILVKLLLSMLAEAAGEGTSTHRELQSVLPSIQSSAEARQLYGKAFGSMLQTNTNYKLNLGARLFVDSFITPQQRFRAIIKAFYHSDIETVNFNQPEETAAIINAWCANATKNHITNIVSQEDIAHSVILLLNTIYFNGLWRRPFPEDQTTATPYYLSPNKAIKIPFMTDTAEYFYLLSTELDAKILRLPYKGYKFAMYIVLPLAVDGLDELMSKVDSSTLHRAQYFLEQVEVKVAIPKFKFTNSINLNEVLKDLGISQMFTNQASFPLLQRGSAVQDRLQVSNVLQKTGIEVNEKGTTAYAATQVSLTNKFGGDIEFIADRPFLFMIEDETTGTLIFSGKVTHPEY